MSFISSTSAGDLMLACILWAGDAEIRHTDGTREIVRDVHVTPATRGKPKVARKRPDWKAKIERLKEGR